MKEETGLRSLPAEDAYLVRRSFNVILNDVEALKCARALAEGVRFNTKAL